MEKVHIIRRKHVTTFKVRSVPFRFVVVFNDDISKHGPVKAIRNMAQSAMDNGHDLVANHRTIIADMLDA
tara:strand:+ start:85 stop:294 length:210 start_codon:yes stop_codon:yes gene_type:complete